MKQKIKIVDSLFAHAKFSTDYQESNFIEWDRDPVQFSDEIVIYTDYNLQMVNPKIKTKIAWLLESPEVTPQSYQWISYNNNKFNTVLTHSKKLLDRGENFKFAPTGGCWIKKEDQKIYHKPKNISIISSNKNMTTGHKLRHQIINGFGDKMMICGRGYNPIEYKLDALKDCKFSVVIENSKKDWYFTEKLIDCFMTGTIPIYWGCPDIKKFFDTRGIIMFDTVFDFSKIMKWDLDKKYIEMKPYIEKNFEKAKEYIISEDFIYKNYLMK